MSAMPQPLLNSAGPAFPGGAGGGMAGVRFAGPGAMEGREADHGGGAGVAGGLRALEGARGVGAGAAAELPAPPSGERWINVATAAERKRVTERAIRLCCPRWNAEGEKAVQVMRETGGNRQWFIRTDADPALRDIPLTADIPVNTHRLTDAQREDVGLKSAILAEWEAGLRAAVAAQVPNAQRLTKEDSTRLFLAKLKADRGIELSASTLRQWYRRSRGADGNGGLIDGRRKNTFKANWEDPFLAAVRKLYMTRSGLSVRYCCKLAEPEAREKGWKIWRVRKVNKFIASIPLAERIHAARGRRRTRTSARVTLIATGPPSAPMSIGEAIITSWICGCG